MKNNIMLLSILLGMNSLAGGPVLDWEVQSHYDREIICALRAVMGISKDFPPNCADLISDKVPHGYGRYRKYDIGDELVWNSYEKTYSYFIKSVSTKGITLMAKNNYGGRDYIYDSEWNVAYYVFLTPAECQRIGQTVIKWLTSETERKSDPPDGSEWQNILTALGYRGCYTDKINYEDARFDILGTFGQLLPHDALRPQVWAIVLGGNVIGDDAGREKCVRGILSSFEGYDPELQKEVLEKVAQYLESVDDEKTLYSKKIAEFVLEKGGTIPERKYWVYDTSWIPLSGTRRDLREGTVRYQAGVEVSPDDLREKEKFSDVIIIE